jgi:hypothetical protein
MECLRVCPKDNLAVNLRSFGNDLGLTRRSSRLDEAFLALVMLGSGLAFTAVFTGPWGALKSAAYHIFSPEWLVYVLGFFALNLVLLPGLYSLCVWAGQKWAQGKLSFRKALADDAQVLLPLGLCAWIAFTVSFAFPKASYVLAVLSDPFGWGWNLFGTAQTTWNPDVSAWSPILEAIILLTGLFWSARVASKLVESQPKPDLRQALPLLGFCLTFSFAMLWLLIG